MTDPRAPDAAPSPAAVEPAPVMAPARSSTDSAPHAADWRVALPDDLRRVAEKFGSPAEVVKSYAALERRLGRSVMVPDESSSAAEIEAFYGRLGRPATPDGYRPALPVGAIGGVGADPAAEGRLTGFLAAVHRTGATPAVVQAAVDWYVAARRDAEDAARREAETARARAEDALRREWGPTYDRRLALSRRAAGRFGGSALAELAERSGLGNDPAWLRAFARIGEAMAEDGLVAGDPVGGATDTKARIDAIMARHFGKPSYGSEAVQTELRSLYETLYSTGPARPDTA